jgi:hypothetical protein
MAGVTVQRSPAALPHKLVRAGALDVARAHITPLTSMLAEQPERGRR